MTVSSDQYLNNIIASPSPGKRASSRLSAKQVSSPELISQTKVPTPTASKRSPGLAGDASLCLDGLKFVVSGVMEQYGRETIEDMILQNGGKVRRLNLIN